MKPLGKMIKIKPDLIENSNTIHTLGDAKFSNTGMIIDIGPEVSEFKPGQQILFKKLIPSEEDGKRFGYIHEEDVLGLMMNN
jgi:hypothetical protein